MGKFTLLVVLVASCAIAAVTALAMRRDDGSAYPVRIALAPATPDGTAPAASAPEADTNSETTPASIQESEQAQQVTVSSPAAVSALASGLRLEDIEFDLADSVHGRESVNGSEVSVTKKLVVNGADAGTARILVGRGSQISVSSQDLETVAGGVATVEGDPAFLSFDQLRDRGLRVRYDPLKDVIEIGS